MEDVMGRLGRALEGRVYVAVCRGLWDFTAKEVFDYVEGLQEGKENMVRVAIIRPKPGHRDTQQSRPLLHPASSFSL
jgi:hypothetical protein